MPSPPADKMPTEPSPTTANPEPESESGADSPFSPPATPSLNFLDVVTFWLSLYALIVLAVQSTMKLSPETTEVLDQADYIVCAVFFIDFCSRLLRAPSKLQYLKWGWLDLLASIPMVDPFRAGRIYRLWRLVRVFRVVRSWHGVARLFIRKRAQNTFALVATTCFVGVPLAAIVVLTFEREPTSNIKTAGDAVWWAYCTVTTVGYGDYYPVTTEGRIMAVILMTMGVGLFGTFAAYVGSLFLGPQSQSKRESIDAMEKQIAGLQESMSRLEALLRERGDGHRQKS